MIASDEDERDACGLGNLSCGIEKILVRAAAAVVAFVLVNIAEAEDDAGLGCQVGSSGKGDFLRAVLSHCADVVHDGGQVAGTRTVMVSLVRVAVGDKHGAEPDVLDEAEAVGLVVVGEDFQLVVVDGGGGGVDRSLIEHSKSEGAPQSQPGSLRRCVT